MTESLWNKYYVSRKSLEVPVKRLPNTVTERTRAERTTDFDCDGLENILVAKASIFHLLRLTARSASIIIITIMAKI